MTTSLNLLLVEDNEDDAALIIREVARSGEFDLYTRIANNMSSFTSLLCNESWDIILCDYQLIGITAEDVIKVLESYSSNIPVIVISGSLSEELQAATSQSYLSKDHMVRLIPIIKRELKQAETYEQILKSWGVAVELKDHHTAGHTLRVTGLAVDLSKRLGLCYPDICSVRIGSYLHDVGKIMVPDDILLKEGRLTQQEMTEMKRHTIYAFQMLRPMKFLRKAIEVPYYHHELWDGSGYPVGLKGLDIPLIARIFTVVDCYDAMTSDRPYRKALSVEFTLTFIYTNAGKMFDPDIVREFIGMMKERV